MMFFLLMGLGVIKHGGADAEFAVFRHENVVVDAPFATAPEGFVVGELVEGDGHIAQLGIHLHDGGTAGEREYFCPRPSQTGQLERSLLDALGQAEPAIFGVNDESRGGHILLVAPRLDIGKSRKVISAQGDDGFSLFHLLGHILVRALGNAGSTHFGSLSDGWGHRFVR